MSIPANTIVVFEEDGVIWRVSANMPVKFQLIVVSRNDSSGREYAIHRRVVYDTLYDGVQIALDEFLREEQ